MRHLVSLFSGLCFASLLVACGSSSSGSGSAGSGGSSSSTGGPGTGGSGTGGSHTGGSGGGGASASSTSNTTSTGTSSGDCSLKASCTVADKACVGLVDNTAQSKFGLRMSELDLSKPAALASGVIAQVVASAVPLHVPACNQNGTATFSWLLQFDTTAGTLKTGGAKPAADATTGFSFVDEMIGGAHIQPVTFTAKPDASGTFSIITGMDLTIPVYLDASGSMAVVLPIHEARFTSGTLSSNQNCIGVYNGTGLDPANSCVPDPTHPGFITAGTVDGYITLAEADSVVVDKVSSSLCAILTNGNGTYTTTNAQGISVCKRDSNNAILLPGDWCASTNAAATSGCTDAVQLAGNFAASSVKILD